MTITMNSQRERWLKTGVFLASLAPFPYLLWATLQGQLGANPIEALTHETGQLALRWLLFTLALSPLCWWLKATWPMRMRRMLGLFAFFYVVLHLLIYAFLDQQLELAAIAEDILERPYVTIGFTGFCILLPLAITSTKRLRRRLGRRWSSLHRWIYLAALAGVVHFVWLAKGDRIEPLVYLALLAVLLALRFVRLASGRPV